TFLLSALPVQIFSTATGPVFSVPLTACPRAAGLKVKKCMPSWSKSSPATATQFELTSANTSGNSAKKNNTHCWSQERLNVRIWNPAEAPVISAPTRLANERRQIQKRRELTTAHSAGRVSLSEVICDSISASTPERNRFAAQTAARVLIIRAASKDTSALTRRRNRITAQSAERASLSSVTSNYTSAFTPERNRITAPSAGAALTVRIISNGTIRFTPERNHITVQSVGGASGIPAL
ncbi:hypothetical protein MHYP_G00167560, partial [Metynnis hypsauchen]